MDVWGQVSFIVSRTLSEWSLYLRNFHRIGGHVLGDEWWRQRLQVASRPGNLGLHLFSTSFYLDHESYLNSPSLTFFIYKELPEYKL